MFAIAWKEYRQIRLVALLLVIVLLGMYFAVSISPWEKHRFGVVVLGAPLIALLLGAHTFSADRRAGTEVFLRALPAGPLQRWIASAATNAALTAAALATFLLASGIAAKEVEFSGLWINLTGPNPLPFAMAFLLVLWSAAVLGSTVAAGPIKALAWAAGAIAGAALLVVWACVRLASNARGAFVSNVGDELFCYIAPAATVATFLVGSLVLERGSFRRVGIVKRFVGIAIVAVIAAAAIIASATGSLIYETRKWAAEDTLSMAFFRELSMIPQDNSLLFRRGESVHFLHRRYADGRWRKYDVEMESVQRAYPQEHELSAISPDGRMLAYGESMFLTRPTQIIGHVIKGIAIGGDSPYDYPPRPVRLLDLESGDTIATELPAKANVFVWIAGWMENPTRLVAVATTEDRQANEVLERELYFISTDGRLLERRSLEDFDSFRRVGSKLASWKMERAPTAHLADYEAGGTYQLYDLETGRIQEGSIEHPSRHLAFSPDFSWQVNLERIGSSGWTVNRGAPPGTMMKRDAIGFEWRGDGRQDYGPLAPLELSGAEGTVRICDFSERTKKALVQFSFLPGEGVFFALIHETAFEEAQGFARIALAGLPADNAEGIPGRTRVRAVAVDLRTLQRREIALPSHLTRIFLDVHYGRMVCYDPIDFDRHARSVKSDCVVLSLPTLQVRSAFRMTFPSGPYSFWPVWRHATFLDRDTLVMPTHRELLFWDLETGTLTKTTQPELRETGFRERAEIGRRSAGIRPASHAAIADAFAGAGGEMLASSVAPSILAAANESMR